jgi:hypothetical protein
LEARAALPKGILVPFLQSDLASVDTSGLLPFLLEGAIENVRRWGIRFQTLPCIGEIIALASALSQPGPKAAKAFKQAMDAGMDNATYLTVVQFLPTNHSRN